MEPRKKILIVDDSITNNMLCEAIFEENDYFVDTAEDGITALEKIQRNKPDLVILDIMMPDVNGFSVLEEIKSKPETQNIEVIMVSAKNDLQSIEKAKSIGAIDYLTKPLESDTLLNSVKKVFGQ